VIKLADPQRSKL